MTWPRQHRIHRNSPLALEARRRLAERCSTRPIAHVSAEMGMSRACTSEWVNRYRSHGELSLLDRSSTPHRQPTATEADVVAGSRTCAAPVNGQLSGSPSISRKTGDDPPTYPHAAPAHWA